MIELKSQIKLMVSGDLVYNYHSFLLRIIFSRAGGMAQMVEGLPSKLEAEFKA
jgi:hypothetical protein